MKTRNLILQAAISSAFLVMAGSAFATTVSTLATAPAFAKELLQGTTPNATALTIPAASAIAITSNVAIPANSTVYVYVKLNGASISSIPSVIPATGNVTVRQADGSGASAAGASLTLSALSLGSTTGTTNPTAVGAGVDYVVFQINTNADTVGVGGRLATVGVAAPLAVNNAASLLTAPITATASVGIGAPAARFGALAANASNYDVTSAAANIATAVQGITVALTANTAAGLIDLSSNPVGSQFTTTGSNVAVSATKANLGNLVATDSTAVQADGATPYTMVSQAAAAGLSLTVAAPAGFFAALGTTGLLTLDSSATCANAAGTNGMVSTAFTSTALAAQASSVAIPSTALPTSTTKYYLCMTIPTASVTSVALVPGTPTLAATLAHTNTAIDSSNVVAAANMYPLAYNGSQVDVNNFVPAAATGYINYVRVINTGSSTAAISAAKIDSTLGTAGTSGVLGGAGFTLAPGATYNFTPTQVEDAIGGTLAVTERPRLRITAPTSGLKVQSIVSQPNGIVNEFSGSQIQQ